jgi:hypothetical protein
LNQLSIWSTGRKSVAAVLNGSILALLFNLAGFSAVRDMTEELPDEYLGREFPWAFVIDLPDSNSYLKYHGSKLWPITKVRVNLRTYEKGLTGTYDTAAYEELWYHYHLPTALRRYTQISIPDGSRGAIIVCPGDGTADPMQRPLAVTDAIVRIVTDIELRHATTGLVLVPQDDYECVVEGLAQFHFAPAAPGIPIQTMGIHLRAYPQGMDQSFYLQKQ